MAYVLAPNNTVEKFPYSIGELKATYPDTSFSARPTDKQLASYDVYLVTIAPLPTYDPALQNVTRNALPTLTNGVWTLDHTVTDKTQAEKDQYQANRRAAMKTTRAKFAMASHIAGIITEAEAEAWAGGNSLPQVVTDAFNANIADATERLAARIEALTTRNIHRTNPFILMLQADLALTDDQTDGLFQ